MRVLVLTSRPKSVFGMSFFYLTPARDGASSSFAVSEGFWIYWAFAAPLTVIALAIWVVAGSDIKLRGAKKT